MPLIRCRKDGKSGWKWNSAGKCYTGGGAKLKAQKDGGVVERPKKKRRK